MRVYQSSILMSHVERFHNIDENIFLNVLKPFIHGNNDVSNSEILHAIDNRNIFNSLFVDSGVYELFSRKSNVNFEHSFNRYATMIKSYHGDIDHYANFDIDFREEPNSPVNKRYQKRLEDMGLKPIPVLHSLNPKEIKYHIDCGYKFVSISSKVLSGNNGWIAVSKAIDTFYDKGIKVHLLGAGSYNRLKDCKAWSCDCSSFGKWASNGRAIYFSEANQKEVTITFRSCNTKGDMNNDYYNANGMHAIRMEYENNVLSHIELTCDDLAGDPTNVVLANSFYFYLLEKRITEIQKMNGVHFNVW